MTVVEPLQPARDEADAHVLLVVVDVVTSLGQHVQAFFACIFKHMLVEPNVVGNRYLHGVSSVDEQKLLRGQSVVRSKVFVQRESEDAV